MGRRRPRGRLERAGRAVRRAVAAARYGTPARDLAPPRPGPPGHAASSLVGLPAGASQGQRGRRRSGLSAPTAPRCAPSALPRALRAARRPLVRLLVRPPGPPLRLPPPPPPPALSLARSLALCGARRAPSSPARPSRPRPFPPPAPERPPRACPGAFSPLRPDSAFPPVCFGLLSPAPHVLSQRDQGGVDLGWSRSLYPLSHLPPLSLPQQAPRDEN